MKIHIVMGIIPVLRGGTSRQISGQAGYRVRKLNSGPVPGRVITTRNMFCLSSML